MRWSKYGAKKTVVDGIRFDSKKEAQRYLQLKVLKETGAIRTLELQPEFLLVPSQKGNTRTERPVKYKADFSYVNKAGEYVVEDVKGMRTPEYIIKRKLMLQKYGIEVVEV